MKNRTNSGFGVLGMVIIAAIIVFGGGYFVYQYQKAKNIIVPKKEEKTLPVAPAVTQPQSNIDTSNWKIYQNNEDGFEVRYPKEWKVIESPEALPTIRNYKYSQEKDAMDLSVGFTGSTENFDVLLKGHIWILTNTGKRIIRQENLKINNFPAAKIESVGDKFSGFEGGYIEYFINKNGKIYEISIIFQEESEQNLSIFNTILSTFKFLP